MNIHPFTPRSFLYALEALRADDGDVTLACSNPEGSGPDNELVEVVGAWTEWETKRCQGETIGQALKNALESAPAEIMAAWKKMIVEDPLLLLDHPNLVPAIQWVVDQLRGDSGAGESHWAQFWQYQYLARIADMSRETPASGPLVVLSCVYCGRAYPPGTPSSQHELLYAHIRECPKHPLSGVTRALQQIAEGVNTAIDHEAHWSLPEMRAHLVGLQQIATDAMGKAEKGGAAS